MASNEIDCGLALSRVDAVVSVDLDVPEVSAEVAEVYEEYYQAIRSLCRIDIGDLLLAFHVSGWMSDLNYLLLGFKDYDNSVAHAIRNIGFAHRTCDSRWQVLKGKPLKGPILDWGCGAGFYACYLALVTGEQIYAHDLPGAHLELARRVFPRFGVKLWTGERVETVVCYNVLEHFADPRVQLNELRRLTPAVYANIDLKGRDASDKADRALGQIAARDLQLTGHLLPLDGNTIEESYDFLRR